MSNLLIYNNQSGELVYCVACPDDHDAFYIDAQPPERSVCVGVGDPAAHWLDLADPDVPVLRDKSPLPYTIVGSAVVDLPNPTTVGVTGPATFTVTVADGVALSTELPGTYTVELDAGPRYYRATVVVEVPA